MTETQQLLQLAQLRMERAISTSASILNDEAVGQKSDLERAITRIVIAINTVAHALTDTADGDETSSIAADVLWQLGEGLNIIVDGARP